MFVYFRNDIFGQFVVSEVRRLPDGKASVVMTDDTTKSLSYEEVQELLSVTERRSHNLELGWLEK